MQRYCPIDNDGKVVKLTGNSKNEFKEGFLCDSVKKNIFLGNYLSLLPSMNSFTISHAFSSLNCSGGCFMV